MLYHFRSASRIEESAPGERPVAVASLAGYYCVKCFVVCEICAVPFIGADLDDTRLVKRNEFMCDPVVCHCCWGDPSDGRSGMERIGHSVEIQLGCLLQPKKHMERGFLPGSSADTDPWALAPDSDSIK